MENTNSIELVDSEEKFNVWSRKQNYYDDNYYYYFNNNAVILPWYAKRETIRINQGTYFVTEVCQQINKVFPIFCHVSLTDPTKVAYTPDAQTGMKDKQVVTTIGKLLYKYLPVFTEARIRELEEDHIAEANPKIKWATGQEITDIYMNKLSDGVGSCMSGNTKFKKENHPTIAYHVPEIKLAYIEKHNKIIARTLVYEASETDKRFIRVYGKPALGKILTKLGYKPGNFVGAKLNTVSAGHSTYLMPYLDGSNSRGSDSEKLVALIDDSIRVITQSQCKAISKLSGAYANAATTTGRVTLQNVNTESLTIECAISGLFVNQFYSATDIEKVYVNNKVGFAIKNAIPAYFVYAAFDSTVVYANPEDVLNTVSNQRLVNTSSTLKKLSSKYYPQDAYETSTRVTKINDEWVAITDVKKVYTYKDGELTHVLLHTSEINKKDYYVSHEGYIFTKHSKYLVTTSKKKVIPGLDHFYISIEGDVTIRRPKYRYYWQGREYYSNVSQSALGEYIDKLRKETVIKSIYFAWKINNVSSLLRAYENNGHYARLYNDASFYQVHNWMSTKKLYGTYELSLLLAEANAIDYNI